MALIQFISLKKEISKFRRILKPKPPKLLKKIYSSSENINIIIKSDYVKLILIVGTFSAIIFHYSRFAFIGDHSPKPDSFLHFPINIFCDFYSLFDGYVRLKYSVAMNYLPALFIPLDFLAKITSNNPYFAIEILVAAYITFLLPYVFLSIRGLQISPKLLLTFALVACNYPVLFTLHSGNFEMLCFLLVAYAVLFRIKKYYFLAGALIGMAAAIKLYPAIFLISIATRYSWKKLFLGFAASFTLSIFLGFSINGSIVSNVIAWSEVVQKGFDNYTGMMVLSYNGVFFGHSLMNAFRIIVGPSFNIAPILPYYSIFSVIAISCVLAIIYKTRYTYLRLLLPACSICLFAPTSQDYKLLYLMVPMLILLRSNRGSHQERVICILISLLLIPKGYVTFYDSTYVNTNTLLNASLLLGVILYCAHLIIFDKKYSNAFIRRRYSHPNIGQI